MSTSSDSTKENKENINYVEYQERLQRVCNKSTNSLRSLNNIKDSMCQKKHRLMKILQDKKKMDDCLGIPSSAHDDLVKIKDNAIYLINNLDEFYKLMTTESNIDIEGLSKHIQNQTTKNSKLLAASLQEFNNATSLISMNQVLKDQLVKLIHDPNECDTSVYNNSF